MLRDRRGLDINCRHQLDPVTDRLVNRLGDRIGEIVQKGVCPETNPNTVAERDQVNIGRDGLICVGQHRVDEIDDGRVLAEDPFLDLDRIDPIDFLGLALGVAFGCFGQALGQRAPLP